MTVHAARAQFPIVFVVTPRARPGLILAFSVIERGPDGEPEVAFGSSEATKLEDLRDGKSSAPALRLVPRATSCISPPKSTRPAAACSGAHAVLPRCFRAWGICSMR
jgi:hypothetical protein